MSMGNEEKQVEGEELYGKMAEESPERKVELETEVEDKLKTGDKSKTLEEKEEENPDLSDLQTALKRLFPELGDAIDNALMFARVAPDMFIPLIRIKVNSAIKRMDPKLPLDVAEKATLYYILTSIGLDGKGRIDTIETTGSVKEAAELEELTKSMGF